ncbi:MAG TPA: zf-HC2 domain-containing protein [Steroidobacteraceae bacterium]|nr:zf-HC2 domain-containing protein [Steroidobacteraceae bacterium]
MSARIPDTHAEAWALLPWLANGRLPASDREWVEAHVAHCAECRGELDAQRKVATQISRDTSPDMAGTPGSTGYGSTGNDEQRSFNKLWARIEASEGAAPSASGVAGGFSSRTSRTVRWLAAAVVVQGFGLALFGFNALRDNAGEIVTVAEVPAQRLNAPAVRVVFAPEASMATINTLLTHQELSIVSGPGTSGNFTAELSAKAVASGASADSVAAVLSKDPNVTFAQPVAR